MSDTVSPARVKRGISCSISVVLPLPDQPANPNTFIRPRGREPAPARGLAEPLDPKGRILTGPGCTPAGASKLVHAKVTRKAEASAVVSRRRQESLCCPAHR